MSRYRIEQLIPILALVIIIVNPVFSQTIVDLNPIKDNSIFQESGEKSNGIGSYLFAGNTNANNIRRGLIMFDIASVLPSGATITSVTLKMNMSQTATGNQTVNLHRILTDWGEGTSDATGEEGRGAQATTNDATWSHAFFNTTQWTNPGGDFASTSSASQTIGSNGFYTWGSTSQMVADVQNWLDNSSSNFGWILIGNENDTKTAKRFDSRENSNVSNRPVLSVTYTTSTNVENINSIPSSFELLQNYPNPFNPETKIQFNLPKSSFVTLEVYNSIGQQIRTLVSEQLIAGQYTVNWNGRNKFGEMMNSGIFYYRLKTEGLTDIKQMVLIK
jgi:hypothetical protein